MTRFDEQAEALAAAMGIDPEEARESLTEAVRAYGKACSLCGQTDGPYPDGDRPKSNAPFQSGCPRCGWCY